MKLALMFPRFMEDSNLVMGIAYIASYLEKNGISVSIIDQTFEGWNTLEEKLKKLNPGILGLTILSNNFEDTVNVVKIAKRCNPNIKIVLGGPQTTVMGKRVFEFIEADIAVMGEGEITMLEVVKAYNGEIKLSEVKGIIYREREQIINTGVREYIKNIDDLPFPSREKFQMEKYMNSSKNGRIGWCVASPAMAMISSRGCPFYCTYCSSHKLFGRKVRFRSVENVMSEIEYLIERYGIKGLYFWDDTFILNKKRVLEICKEIKKYNLEWYCQSRVDTIDEETLIEIRKAGCRTISFGAESGSQRILDNSLKKGITLEQTRKTISAAKKAGLTVHCTFMIGTPGETKEDMEKTIEFAKELSPFAIDFNVTTPFYGTELYDMVKAEGQLLTDKIFEMDLKGEGVVKTKDFDPQLVAYMYQKAVRDFFLQPKYIFRQILSIRSFDDVKRKYRGLVILLDTIINWGKKRITK